MNATRELTIWGRLNAYNVQKVVWAAEELGLAYLRHDAGRGYDAVDRNLNPNGRVPVIQDGDLVLWESNVIVRYLSARYGAGRLCPRELEARVSVEQWMDWEGATVFRGFLPVYNVISRGQDFFTREQAEQAVVETASRLQILDAHLATRRFVGGDQLTMGDIPIGILADYIVRTGRELPGLANVKRWHAELVARPAMQRAMRVEWANVGAT